MAESVLDAAVPIVGQRVKALGCTIIGLIQCQCEAKMTLQPIAQSGEIGLARVAAVCPSCHYVYAIQSIAVDARGQILFNLDIRAPVNSDA